MASISVKKNDSVSIRVAVKDNAGVAVAIDRVVLNVAMSTPYVNDNAATDGANGISTLSIPPNTLNEAGIFEATITVYNSTTFKKTMELKVKVDDHIG